MNERRATSTDQAPLPRRKAAPRRFYQARRSSSPSSSSSASQQGIPAPGHGGDVRIRQAEDIKTSNKERQRSPDAAPVTSVDFVSSSNGQPQLEVPSRTSKGEEPCAKGALNHTLGDPTGCERVNGRQENNAKRSAGNSAVSAPAAPIPPKEGGSYVEHVRTSNDTADHEGDRSVHEYIDASDIRHDSYSVDTDQSTCQGWSRQHENSPPSRTEETSPAEAEGQVAESDQGNVALTDSQEKRIPRHEADDGRSDAVFSRSAGRSDVKARNRDVKRKTKRQQRKKRGSTLMSKETPTDDVSSASFTDSVRALKGSEKSFDAPAQTGNRSEHTIDVYVDAKHEDGPKSPTDSRLKEDATAPAMTSSGREGIAVIPFAEPTVAKDQSSSPRPTNAHSDQSSSPRPTNAHSGGAEHTGVATPSITEARRGNSSHAARKGGTAADRAGGRKVSSTALKAARVTVAPPATAARAPSTTPAKERRVPDAVPLLTKHKGTLDASAPTYASVLARGGLKQGLVGEGKRMSPSAAKNGIDRRTKGEVTARHGGDQGAPGGEHFGQHPKKSSTKLALNTKKDRERKRDQGLKGPEPARNPIPVQNRSLSTSPSPSSSPTLLPESAIPTEQSSEDDIIGNINSSKSGNIDNTDANCSSDSLDEHDSNGREESVLETVDVTGEMAQWAADNSQGGEFTGMLETIKKASGAGSMRTRVALKQGGGKGGRPRMERVHVDISAPSLAQARMAKALLVTHLKSRLELLRLEHSRRSMEGSLSALELEVSQGLRVQFATRSEWIGLLIGKAGARIRNVQQVTGCTVTIIDSHDIAHGRNGGGRSTDRVSQRDLANHRWGDDGRSERRGGKAGASAMSCRIAISGSDADSVRQAREDMDFVEARIAVGATQAAILNRYPRTRLIDLREQSGCAVVDLSAVPQRWNDLDADSAGNKADLPEDGFDEKNNRNARRKGENKHDGGSVSEADMYADGPDVDYRYISDGDGNGATLSDGGQLSSYQRQQCSEAAAVVRLLGPRPAVESARVLLGVILQYMDRVRNIKEGDVAVRAKLQNIQANYGKSAGAGTNRRRRSSGS